MFEVKTSGNMHLWIYHRASAHADHFSTGVVPNRVMCDTDVGSFYLGSVRRSQRINARPPKIGRLPPIKDELNVPPTVCDTRGSIKQVQPVPDNKGVDALFLSSSSILSSVGAPPLLCQVSMMDWRSRSTQSTETPPISPKPQPKVRASFEGVDPIPPENLIWVNNVFA